MSEQDTGVTTPPEEFELYELPDEKEVMKAVQHKVLRKFIYRFPMSGKTVTGLSHEGVEWVCRELAKRGEVLRAGSEVKYFPDPAYPDYWIVMVMAQRIALSPDGTEHALDRHVGSSSQSSKQESWSYGADGKKVEGSQKFSDDHKWFAKAVTKAERNAFVKCIPKAFVLETIALALRLPEHDPAPAQSKPQTAQKATAPPPTAQKALAPAPAAQKPPAATVAPTQAPTTPAAPAAPAQEPTTPAAAPSTAIQTPPATPAATPAATPTATPAAPPAASADPSKLAEELNSLIKVKIPDLTKRKAAWKCLTGLDSMKGAPVELLQGMIYGLKSGCKIGEDGVGAFMTTTDGEHILLPKSRVPVENQATPAPTGPVAVRPDGQLF